MSYYCHGHGANSQLGPVLATALQSGHIFASSVQAWALGGCCTCGFEQAVRIIIVNKEEINSSFLLIVYIMSVI